MYLDIDLSTVPPLVTLEEPEDFTRFSARVTVPEHTYVAPSALSQLAGDLATDPDWKRQLADMVAFADGHGWVREDGAVRAHLESSA